MLQHIRRMGEQGSSLLLLLLLTTDFAFLLLHFIDRTIALSPSLCNTAGLCGYGAIELYQLVKLFWVLILLACVILSTKCSGYISWILVFTCLLFDKALQIHQNIGSRLAYSFAAYLPDNLGLQPRQFELAVLTVGGTFLLAIVAWAYFRGPHVFKKVSNDMLLFVLVWMFFGLFADIVAAIKLGPAAEFAADLIEDGGEMAVVSLILWYVFLLAIRNGRPEWFLHDLLRKPLTRRVTWPRFRDAP